MRSLILLFALITAISGAELKAARMIEEEPQSWDKREHHYKSKDSFGAFEILYKGKIVVSHDDKSVVSISPGGFLKISKESFGNARVINIESDTEGNLSMQYFEGKNEQQFDPEGKKWLADILNEVVRKTGISAEQRVMRIYKNEGIEGVLDEIAEIKEEGPTGDYTKVIGIYIEKLSITGGSVANLYMKILVDKIDLKKEDHALVLRAISDVRSNSTKGILLRTFLKKYEMDEYIMEKFLYAVSTHEYNTERGNTLREFQKKYSINRDNYKPFFAVIKEMSINSEKGNVLKPLLEAQKLDARVFEELIETVEDFTSDSEKAAVLRKAIKYMPDEPNVKYAFKSAVNSLSSSYRLLKEELIWMVSDDFGKKSMDKAEIMSILKTALTYDPNTQKTTALRTIHVSLNNDEEVIETYFQVIKSMDNEMEQYNVLLELVNMHKLEKHGLLILLDICEDIAEDDYKHGASAILRDLVGITEKDISYFDMINTDADVRKAYFEVLNEIDHNSGKEELIGMFCEKKKLEANTIIELLKAAEDIDVDIETASSLARIREVMPKNNSEINYIYKSIARDIESDYEYEKVLKDFH